MPKWVDECIKKYKNKGYTDKKAREYCYGAYNNKKKNK